MRRWSVSFAKFALVLAAFLGGLMLWNLRPPAVPEPQLLDPVEAPESFEPLRLRVVTWNVWGLRWISPRRAERIAALAREVAALRPDVVGFQEAFVAKDRATLAEALRPLGLEHTRYYPSGLAGSGLFLASRYPIESEGFIRFAKNGRPERVDHGDWWAGKGLSLATVTLPGGVRLYLGNTHLHAGYRGNPYLDTRVAQAGQLVPWAQRVRATGCPALWMGDWNNTPGNEALAPLAEAGAWNLLTGDMRAIDHIFGSGEGWEWRLVEEGKHNGRLETDPEVPWSDHAARWVEVELRKAL